jgi:hypothetical protein
MRPLSRLTVVAVVAAAIAASLTGCGTPARHSSTHASVSFPNTATGRQARWLFRAVRHLPIPDAAITAHFDRSYLASLPAPAAATLNAGLVGVEHLRLDAITTNTPRTLVFVVTVNGKAKLRVRIAVDRQGLISHLHLEPTGGPPPAPPAPPTSTPPPSTIPAAHVRQIPIGVGSPPLKGTLTLPAGNGPFPAVVLVGGRGRPTRTKPSGPTSHSETLLSASPPAASPASAMTSAPATTRAASTRPPPPRPRSTSLTRSRRSISCNTSRP